MAKNLAPSSRKWRKKNQIGENGGERKINPSANPVVSVVKEGFEALYCLSMHNLLFNMVPLNNCFYKEWVF